MPQRRLLTLSDSGHLAVRSEPLPEPGPGEVLIHVRASAVSAGTELGRFAGRDLPAAPAGTFRPFGYQCAGEAAGGGRVAAMGAGYALHADQVLVPQNLVIPLPENVAFADAAFCALGATAMHAVRRGEVVFGERVAVLGLGALGQLVARVCRIAGAEVVAVERLPLRAEIARAAGIDARTGFDEGDRGFDAAFVCFGGEASAAVQEIYRRMRQAPDTHRSGRIVLVGGASATFSFGAALGNVDVRSAARTGPGYHDKAWERGEDYPAVTVRWSTRAHLELFVRWLADGTLHVADLATDRVGLDDAPAACAALIAAPQEHLDVVITYGSETRRGGI